MWTGSKTWNIDIYDFSYIIVFVISKFQHIHTESAYENQVAGLTRSVATLEESLKAAENEKHSMMQDLQAVRDLCARLESAKDNLQRQLTVKTLELEKVELTG